MLRSSRYRISAQLRWHRTRRANFRITWIPKSAGFRKAQIAITDLAIQKGQVVISIAGDARTRFAMGLAEAASK